MFSGVTDSLYTVYSSKLPDVIVQGKGSQPFEYNISELAWLTVQHKKAQRHRICIFISNILQQYIQVLQNMILILNFPWLKMLMLI